MVSQSKGFFNPKNLMVLKRNARLFYGRLKFRLLLLIVPILLMVIAGVVPFSTGFRSRRYQRVFHIIG